MPIIVIYALAVFLIFSGGFGTGYKVRKDLDTVTYAKQLEIALKSKDKEIKIVHDVEKVYITEAPKINTVYKTITKEIVKYVPKIQTVNSACNLTLGTVRLLNDNASNKMPETTRVINPTYTKSSTITGETLIEYTNKLLNRYKQVKLQCDQLIDYSIKIATIGEK